MTPQQYKEAREKFTDYINENGIVIHKYDLSSEFGDKTRMTPAMIFDQALFLAIDYKNQNE